LLHFKISNDWLNIRVQLTNPIKEQNKVKFKGAIFIH